MNSVSAARVRDRTLQFVLIVSTLAISWLGMMVVHEFGHVLFGWSSGARVARVSLSPLEFSRTDMQKYPHALFVAWGGALIGSVLPRFVSRSWCRLQWPAWFVIRFFAGFCLVANGIYLGVVSFIPNAADPGDMIVEVFVFTQPEPIPLHRDRFSIQLRLIVVGDDSVAVRQRAGRARARNPWHALT